MNALPPKSPIPESMGFLGFTAALLLAVTLAFIGGLVAFAVMLTLPHGIGPWLLAAAGVGAVLCGCGLSLFIRLMSELDREQRE